MAMEKFSKITIDLRPFGWGIRDVDVVWPEGSIGSKEIQDDSVEMVDLSRNVKDTMLTGDDRVTQEDIDSFDV